MLKTEFTLRRATDDDVDFAFELYAEVRHSEFDQTGWPPEQMRSFLRMQFDFRSQAYQMQLPAAETFVVMVDGNMVGQVILDRQADHICLVDVAILKKW